jgi:hypothetical protein
MNHVNRSDGHTAANRLWSWKRPVRIFRDRKGFHAFVGPWVARFSWDRQGYFVNGSHWFSGWHSWAEDAELRCSDTK